MKEQYVDNKELLDIPYDVIDLRVEYPGYDGEVKYAIITDLNEEELDSQFCDHIEQYKPFIILTCEMGEAIHEFDRNEDMFKKRYQRGLQQVDFNCIENVLYDMWVRDNAFPEEDRKRKARALKAVSVAVEELIPSQKSVLIKYELENKSLDQIAQEEGRSNKSISRSIVRARKHITDAVMKAEVAS